MGVVVMPTPKRSVRFELVLTAEEAAEIKRRAAAAHRSMASYVRARALADWQGESQ